MKNYPEETLRDKLEAYPLRLNVAALPERRFFKMIRTLTICVVLLGALLIVLGVLLNYQIAHMDVTVREGNNWQFYHIDPQEKRMHTIESAVVEANPMQLLVEAKLREYLIMRNSTSMSVDEIEKNFSANGGRISQFSSVGVFSDFVSTKDSMLSKTIRKQGKKLIREAHIYDLRHVNTNLWMAIVEIFDMPVTEDSVGVCRCSDNSKECLDCKIEKNKNRERYKIWMRTGFNRPKKCIIYSSIDQNLCYNPLGISVDEYIVTVLPIHNEDTYWNLPPALRPEF